MWSEVGMAITWISKLAMIASSFKNHSFQDYLEVCQREENRQLEKI
jgi:hypothetical protein